MRFRSFVAGVAVSVEYGLYYKYGLYYMVCAQARLSSNALWFGNTTYLRINKIAGEQ